MGEVWYGIDDVIHVMQSSPCSITLLFGRMHGGWEEVL